MSSCTISQNPSLCEISFIYSEAKIDTTRSSPTFQQTEEIQDEKIASTLKYEKFDDSQASTASILIGKCFQHSQKPPFVLEPTNGEFNIQYPARRSTTNFSLKHGEAATAYAEAINNRVDELLSGSSWKIKSSISFFEEAGQYSILQDLRKRFQDRNRAAQQKVEEARANLNNAIESRKNAEQNLQNAKSNSQSANLNFRNAESNLQKLDERYRKITEDRNIAHNEFLKIKNASDLNTHHIFTEFNSQIFTTYLDWVDAIRGSLKRDNISIQDTYRFPEFLHDNPQKNIPISERRSNWLMTINGLKCDVDNLKSIINSLNKLMNDDPTARRNLGDVSNKFQQLVQKLIDQLPKEELRKIKEIDFKKVNLIDSIIREVQEGIEQLLGKLNEHFKKEREPYNNAWSKYNKLDISYNQGKRQRDEAEKEVSFTKEKMGDVEKASKETKEASKAEEKAKKALKEAQKSAKRIQEKVNIAMESHAGYSRLLDILGLS